MSSAITQKPDYNALFDELFSMTHSQAWTQETVDCLNPLYKKYISPGGLYRFVNYSTFCRSLKSLYRAKTQHQEKSTKNKKASGIKKQLKKHNISDDEYQIIEGIRDASKKTGVGLQHMPHGWAKTNDVSVFFRNPLASGYNAAGSAEHINFEKIIKKLVQAEVYVPPVIKTDYVADRLVYTDTHTGMETDPKATMYKSPWGKKELLESADALVGRTLASKKSNTLIIDDLGDFADGWDRKTTSKRHELPQNMTNEEIFDAGLAFKLKMLQGLIKEYSEIRIHNVCNSNHGGGGFDYVINSAFKKIAEVMYSNVQVENFQQFIQHYTIGDRCNMLCHGKDEQHMKFGLKPVLDNKAKDMILGYVAYNNLEKYKLEFSKGDSHQFIFDSSTSDVFKYFSYPALSPSSDWVKTNFKLGKRGAVFFNYAQDHEETIPFMLS